MPRVFVCSFASGPYAARGAFVERAWSESGLFERVWVWRPEDLFPEFDEETSGRTSTRKGDGWWRWKSEIALRSMQSAIMEEDDVLFYADVGCAMDFSERKVAYFRHMISRLCDRREFAPVGVLFCQWKHKDRRFIKREAAEFVLGPIEYERLRSGQFMGGLWMLRKCDESLGLLREWREYCCHVELLDEEMRVPQPSFMGAHRHDQSIFSMVVRRSGLPFLVEVCMDTSRSIHDDCPVRALRRKKAIADPCF
jgi:hypothetical protein